MDIACNYLLDPSPPNFLLYFLVSRLSFSVFHLKKFTMFTVHQVHLSTPFNYFEREILIVVPVCDVRDGRSD
jgi:hypothetical protein